jgi:hypothetical protein
MKFWVPQGRKLNYADESEDLEFIQFGASGLLALKTGSAE